MSIKYFIYCRKSTDSEDRQIASLPAQRNVLTEYTKKANLEIADIYEESKSAFTPGRPKFNKIIERIENGEGNGVISWDASRIARNTKDGGNFIYLMDIEKIIELRTPSKIYFNTPEDKFALNIEFTVAKKSSDDLSKNVKRGNKHKFLVKKEWLGPAKPGYINYTDPITAEKRTISDKKRGTAPL